MEISRGRGMAKANVIGILEGWGANRKTFRGRVRILYFLEPHIKGHITFVKVMWQLRLKNKTVFFVQVLYIDVIKCLLFDIQLYML